MKGVMAVAEYVKRENIDAALQKIANKDSKMSPSTALHAMVRLIEDIPAADVRENVRGRGNGTSVKVYIYVHSARKKCTIRLGATDHSQWLNFVGIAARI